MSFVNSFVYHELFKLDMLNYSKVGSGLNLIEANYVKKIQILLESFETPVVKRKGVLAFLFRDVRVLAKHA